MIHAKLLIRRLAYVPWLLAAGLVLGWAGEVEAVTVTLSLDKDKVREDAGETTITAKAKVAKDAAADIVVTLSVASTAVTVRDSARSALNKRYRMILPTITIPKGKKEATGAIIFTPIDDALRGFDFKNDGIGDDLLIPIQGNAGSQHSVTPNGAVSAVSGLGFTLLDNDKLSTRLDLSFDPKELSNEAPNTDIKVTATLDGSKSSREDTLTLRFNNPADAVTYAATVAAVPAPVDGVISLLRATSLTLPSGNAVARDSILTRDSDYSGTTNTLKFRKRHESATTTIKIDPKEDKKYNAYIAMQAVGVNRTPVGVDSLKGIDLNLNGNTNDTFDIVVFDTQPTSGRNDLETTLAGKLLETELGCDYDTDTGGQSCKDSQLDTNQFAEENELGIDFNGDGRIHATIDTVFHVTKYTEGSSVNDMNGDGDILDVVFRITSTVEIVEGITRVKASVSKTATSLPEYKLLEKDLTFPIKVYPGFIRVKDAALLATKAADAGLKAEPRADNQVREEGGEKEITLKVFLQNPVSELDAPATVRFTIAEVEGTRDVDYTVSVRDTQIGAGEKEGTTTLTLNPINNERADGNKSFTVSAAVGATDTKAGTETITIIDDESLTEKITLTVSPNELKAGTGPTDVTVTGTLNGKTFDKDVTVNLVVTKKLDQNAETLEWSDHDKAAQRDTDYTADLHTLVIPKGAVSGKTSVEITPLAGGDKLIGLMALKSPVKNDDDVAVEVIRTSVTLKDADPAAETSDPGALAFSVDVSSTPIEGTVGTAIDPIKLPEAENGTAPLSYSVSAALPAGLSFDAATRTISGTPAAAGTDTLIYTVIDSDGDSDAMKVPIEISAAPAPTVTVARVTSSHSSVRENGKMTTLIAVTATLESASAKDERVRFTIVAPSAGKAAAIRDVDYTANLGGEVTIAAGDLQGTTMLSLTPLDNALVDGNKYLGVQASAAEASGGKAQTDIKIADDETRSTSISLSVTPHTVSEGDDERNLTVTATLDGKVLGEAINVIISVDPASAATRDVDYNLQFDPKLVIPAGSTSGSVTLRIDPTADNEDEGNETITLNGATAGLTGGSANITLSDGAAPAAPPEAMPLAFAEGMMIADIGVTANSEMSSEPLPEASGGSGDISYSVSELPDGLSFDAATRTISGTPTTADTTEVTYTATDSGGATASLTFSITVNAGLEFGDFGSLFGSLNGGAGKANPATSHEENVISFVVGQAADLVLPAVSGGTPPLTYSVSGLPAGLSFDSATRRISGTPTELSESVIVTYTVTDAGGTSNSVPFAVVVIEPPLDAPDALVAEDYRGADGAGDQGGFVLLTWDLSEHHDEIDGYRIFRELPVLNNERVPWAMVDAVPSVQIGRAIVATLDNVATNWGIAAERGGQTTHGAAKAAFVRAENLNQPYELMAETLMASREAARAGDAPVFASLLPEALAFAQGVAPKLNSVEGVLESSAITITEEPVRAIDNIAPLAVPSLSVLDAPNDAGSRIVLTWTLSPSDRLLQGVVAEAIGPAETESVVGVHGYGIYRRAAGEDEFVLVAQVKAGGTSFVDETALNGVRYTYQVRPYDLDNEPVSEIEQTALAVRNRVFDSEGRAIFGLFGADNRIGFDDFFIFADNFGLTAEDAAFDSAFDLAPSAMIDFDDFFVFADNFGRSTAAAGKRVPLLAGLNADVRLYLDARTALPSVGEDFVLDVRVADFVAVKGYGLQVQYDAGKLEFVEALTDQPLGGSALAAPQVLSDEAGVLALAAHGDVVAEGEVELSLVFRAKTEIENTVIEITDSQTYDREFGFNGLALPAPVALQTRPEVFALANNYPNPFNPATTIQYALPQAADVELTVYNVVGQAVRTLVAEHQSAGRYVVEWDATNDSGHSLSSGMYFYRLQAGGEFREVKKMLLLK